MADLKYNVDLYKTDTVVFYCFNEMFHFRVYLQKSLLFVLDFCDYTEL